MKSIVQSTKTVEQGKPIRLDQGGINFDDLDPSLAAGYQIQFYEDVPVYVSTPQSFDTDERTVELHTLRIKLLINKKGDETKPYQLIKIELTTETDIFFHFQWNMDIEGFKLLQSSQKLNIHFDQFVPSLIKMFQKTIQSHQDHQIVFYKNKTSSAVLKVIHNTEYKQVELLSLDFTQSSDPQMRQNVMFRFNTIFSRQKTTNNQIEDVINILQNNNQQLLSYIKKNTSLTNQKQAF